jgi:hypothetical protein
MEAKTHTEATGKCVREYGLVTGYGGCTMGARDQTIIFQVAVSYPSHGVRLFLAKPFHFLNPSHISFLLAYKDGTECSETLAFNFGRVHPVVFS